MADLLNTNPNDSYGDDAIVTLSPREHIRLRPGMYIGKLGDGTQADDGIYVLIKEVVDNSVDEFIMGAGRQIDISIEDKVVSVRDYGRGIPLKSLAAAVSEMNTGGKYGGSAFKKTVGLNGVGVKAVNMLSGEFTARSVRDGEARTVTFAKGLEVSDKWESGVREKNGTFISFRVDEEVFGEYAYNLEYVEQMVRNYTYLNLGLTFNFNGNSYVSKNGLLDLLNENMTEEPLYAPIHLSGDDIEVAIAHARATARAISRSSMDNTPRRAVRTRRLSARPSPRPSRSSTTRTTTRRTSARRSSPPFRSRSPTRSSNRRPRSSSDRRRSSRACRCAIFASISWASTSTITCTSIPRRRRCSSGRSSRTKRSAKPSQASRRRRARRPRRFRSTTRNCATARYTAPTSTSWPNSR